MTPPDPASEESWQPLPDGAGTALAVSGNIAAAADPGWLRVWRDGVRVAEVAADAPTPGRPQIVGDRVHWGPTVVRLGGAADEVQVEAYGQVGPPEGYVATAYGWSPDGLILAGAAHRLSTTGSEPPSVVWCCDLGSGERTVIWSGADVAPTTLDVGNVIVVGHRRPTVHDSAGRLLATLPEGIAPLRIEVIEARPADLVLVAEATRLLVCTVAGDLVGVRDGLFVDGAWAPGDPPAVLAVDFAGQLIEYAVAPGLPVLRPRSAPDRVLTVTADAERVLAAFAFPPGLRTQRRSASADNSAGFRR